MSDIDTDAARFASALESDLFAIMEDFDAPQPTRDAASRILRQKLNDQLKAAIGNFQASALKLVDLVDQLRSAVDTLGAQVPNAGATAALPRLARQAGELRW